MWNFLASFLVCLATTLNIFAASEQTLAIIKPDAVAANRIGEIISRLEHNGLHVQGLKMTRLQKAQAEKFYEIHKDRPFFNELVTFMSSGPIVAIALEGENSVTKNRQVMGATNPKDAVKGTIRGDLGTSITQNAIHGSDSIENATTEISFFFKPEELFAETVKK